MNKKYFLFIILCLVLELVGAYYIFTYTPNPNSTYMILHLVMVTIFQYFDGKYFQEGSNHHDLLILFLPVVGFVCLLVSESIFAGKNYEKLIAIEKDLKEYLTTDWKEKFKMISKKGFLGAAEVLSVSSPKEKKKFLMEFDYPDIAFKVRILKEAMKDNDLEVIHFASAELTKIEKKIYEEIKEANRTGSLEKQLKAYLDYYKSGLLEDSIRDIYQNKILSLIENNTEKNENIDLHLLEVNKLFGVKN